MSFGGPKTLERQTVSWNPYSARTLIVLNSHIHARHMCQFSALRQGPPGADRWKHRSAWTALIYVKCRYSTSHKSLRLLPVVYISWHLVFVHLTIKIFSFDFGRLQAKLHFLQKRQENAVIWCILVIVIWACCLQKITSINKSTIHDELYQVLTRCVYVCVCVCVVFNVHFVVV